MKIRNGYVSNSSSSSFVIKTSKSDDEIQAEIENVINLIKLTDQSVNFEYKIYIISDGEEVTIRSEYDNSLTDELKKLLELMYYKNGNYNWIGE